MIARFIIQGFNTITQFKLIPKCFWYNADRLAVTVYYKGYVTFKNC